MSLENNNNNDKRKEKRTLYQILDKEGFYIILLLCIVVVTSTALWVNLQREDYYIGETPSSPFEDEYENEKPEVTLVDEYDYSDDEEETIKPTGKIGQGKPVEEEKDNALETEKVENSAVNEGTKEDGEEDSEEVSVASGEVISMIVPVVGKLGLPFADDHLVYHKTLDQWSTHKGVDIQAGEGTPVKAALGGEIVKVETDKIMGITITIKHDANLFTKYSNLSTEALVKVGDKVEKGQTISGVGKSATVKALEGTLLHFQVIKDDGFVDPQIYIKLK